MDEAEVMDFLKKRARLLDGVCITGGEPLIQNGLEDFILRVRALGYPVKLDTNGYFPERLSPLLEKGLVDYVAMDIKSDMEGYALATGRNDIDMERIKESIAIIMSRAPDYEFRTTLVGGIHDADSVRGACELLRGAKKYFLQSYADSGAIIDPRGLYAFSKQQLLEFLAIARDIVPTAELRGVD